MTTCKLAKMPRLISIYRQLGKLKHHVSMTESKNNTTHKHIREKTVKIRSAITVGIKELCKKSGKKNLY